MKDDEKEKFQMWSKAQPVQYLGINKIAWQSGWDAAQSKRDTQDGTFFIEQFKADRALLRAKIMDKAVDAFRNGLDETARLYRDLANELFGKQA